MNPAMHQMLVKQREKIARRQMTFQPPRLAQPLIIVSAPRAGSTLLFETLAHFTDLWTIGEESHEIIEGIPALHPVARGYSSNRLIETDASPEIKTLLYDRFARQLQDCQNRPLIELPVTEQPSEVRLLEKTPKNALRIPFLRALFPDARFIFLYRDPAENISSIVDGWQSKRFIAYHALPGWSGAWSFLLIPGWETLVDRPLVEIAAHQWRVANETILVDLASLPREAWLFIRYADLVAPRAPKPTIAAIAQFADLTWDESVEQIVSRALPLSRMTLSAPAPDKWRKHSAELESVMPGVEQVVRKIETISKQSF
jgi:hypothetical protein